MNEYQNVGLKKALKRFIAEKKLETNSIRQLLDWITWTHIYKQNSEM